MTTGETILIMVQTFLAVVTGGFAAFHAFRTAGRLETYRLEINSRMDQFIELTRKSSFAAGKESARVTGAVESVTATAEAAAKVLDDAATRASSKLDAAADRAAALLKPPT